MTKFQRDYILTAEVLQGATEQNAIQIQYPLTLNFNVERTTSSSVNTGTFRIYNLTEKTRNLLFQDRFSIKNSTGNRKRITLQAGYKNLSTIFVGDILEGYSYRQGADIITYINALDGGFSAYNSFTNLTLKAGGSFSDLFTKLASNLGLEINKVGTIEGSHKRAIALNGNTFNLLKNNFRDTFYVDLNKINNLNTNEVTEGELPLISSETGLIGTPQRQGSKLIINLIFEPRIKVGQLVKVESNVNKLFDGQYKVTGVAHSGIISGAINGECITTLELFIGDRILGNLTLV